MSSDDQIYDYIVIGGGLGGIISCFILLKKYTDCSILWIDQDGFKQTGHGIRFELDNYADLVC